MAKIDEVLVEVLEGRLAGSIMTKFKIRPSRLKEILASKRMRERRELNRQIVAVASEAWMVTQTQNLTQQLLKVAFGSDDEATRKTCQMLLDQIAGICSQPGKAGQSQTEQAPGQETGADAAGAATGAGATSKAPEAGGTGKAPEAVGLDADGRPVPAELPEKAVFAPPGEAE